jgi:TolB protein
MDIKVKKQTAEKRFFLIIVPILIGCIFTLSQCDKIEVLDGGIFPTEKWDYSKVAFIAPMTDNSSENNLRIMDKSGTGMRKIVDKTVACQKPVRSHSGTRLLFTSVKFDSWVNEDNSVGMSSEYELYIINTDGTGLTLIDRIGITESGRFGSVAWSPDDNQIAYVKYSGADWEKTDLILYNISGNTHTTLQTERNVCSPKFSPNGKQIVYCALTETGHHIYKMGVNGDNNQLIISNASSPKWSPQGDKIAYLSS